MKTNQNGFAQIIVVLAVVAVLAAGGAGVWYFNRSVNSEHSNLSNNQNVLTGATTSQTIQSDDRQNQNKGWETYNNDKYGIQFSYPPVDDFKSLDRQSAKELLARGIVKDLAEAKSMARKAFDPGYENDLLYVTFGAYSLSAGIMSVGLGEMMKERVKLLIDDVDQMVGDASVGGLRQKKLLLFPIITSCLSGRRT